MISVIGSKKLHELAKELSLTSAELIQRIELLRLLPGVKLMASSLLEANLAENILRHFRLPDSSSASSALLIRQYCGVGKKKVHELAKDLSLTSAELIQKIVEWKLLPGVKLRASSRLERYLAEIILRCHSTDNLAENIERCIKFPGRGPASSVPVIRRHKKTVPAEVKNEPTFEKHPTE